MSHTAAALLSKIGFALRGYAVLRRRAVRLHETERENWRVELDAIFGSDLVPEEPFRTQYKQVLAAMKSDDLPTDWDPAFALLRNLAIAIDAAQRLQK